MLTKRTHPVWDAKIFSNADYSVILVRLASTYLTVDNRWVVSIKFHYCMWAIHVIEKITGSAQLFSIVQSLLDQFFTYAQSSCA